MYIRIWRFRPQPQRVTEFQSVYGPNGDWARLFRLAKGFLDTELIQSTSDSAVYLTIDRWTDAESWEAFKASYAGPYHDLDRRCQELTIEESEVGTFNTPAA